LAVENASDVHAKESAPSTADPSIFAAGSADSSVVTPASGAEGQPTKPLVEVTDPVQVGGEVRSNTLGLSGGHFDLNTVIGFSTQEYLVHTHEYDDKYNVTGVDFFSIWTPESSEINEAIEPGQRFVLVLVNAGLSTGAMLNINGSDVTAVKYTADFQEALGKGVLPVYTLGQPSVAGDLQLKRLSVNFAADAIVKGGLVSSVPRDVKVNKPGPNGEYRNGALTLQAVEVEDFALEPVTGSSASKSKILWETSLFWHKD